MEKNKQYFNPNTGSILSANEVKSIEMSYKNKGSKGTFADYIKTQHFAKASNLYPKLDLNDDAQNGKYPKLSFDDDEDDDSADEDDTNKFSNAKQTNMAVVDTSDDDKDIPVLERQFIAMKPENSDSEDSDSEDLSVLEKNKDSDSDSDHRDEYVNGRTFNQSDLPVLEKRVFQAQPNKPVLISEQDLFSGKPLKKKKHLEKAPTSDSDDDDDNINSTIAQKPKLLFKTETGKIASKVDSDSEDEPIVSYKTVKSKIKSNFDESSPLMMSRTHVKSHINATSNKKQNVINIDNIDSHISKMTHSPEKSTLSFIERLNRDEDEENRSKSSAKKNTAPERSQPKNLVASTTAAKPISEEKKKLMSKSALSVATKDIQSFLLPKFATEKFSASMLQSELSHVFEHLDSKSGAWKSTSPSVSQLKKQYQVLNIEKIATFSKSDQHSVDRFLSASRVLFKASTSLATPSALVSSPSPLKTVESKTVASTPKLKESTLSSSSPPPKIATLFNIAEKDGQNALKWISTLYEKLVLKSKTSTSEQRLLWDRVVISDPHETFPIPWESISARFSPALQIFWQDLFAAPKKGAAPNIKEHQRIVKNILIFAEIMIQLGARRGNDDEISRFFALTQSQHRTRQNEFTSLRQQIYDMERVEFDRAVRASSITVNDYAVEYEEEYSSEYSGEPSSSEYGRIPPMESKATTTRNIFDVSSHISNKFTKHIITTKIPDSFKKEFSWVVKNDFAEKVKQIVLDKSMSKDNVVNLYNQIVRAIFKDRENISLVGTRILLLFKFSFDSYKIVSEWVNQGEDSGVDLKSDDFAKFQQEVYTMHKTNLANRWSLNNI